MNQSQGGNATRTTPATGEASENVNSNQAICRNMSCRTVLPVDSVFCMHCSCSICGQYDENKDPSLWLVCEPDSPHDECCGLTCHMECAFKAGNLGVVSTGEFMPLDASYWCTSCGKISGILGCWKKQLSIAKDALYVDVLCYRISLSYRLLDGTSRFIVLHEIVKGAMSKLEAELGPINHGSYKTGHGNISMLSVARDVQKLCADAIKMADEWTANNSNWAPDPRGRDGPLPPACRFLFEEISSSSVVIDLIDDSPPALIDSINRYDIWCWRCWLEGCREEPTASFPAFNKRIKISHLKPSTMYAFRIVSFTEAGPLGISEAKCMMKNADTSSPAIVGSRNENPRPEQHSRRIMLRSAGTNDGALSGMEAPVLSVHPSEIGCNEVFSSARIEQACGPPERTTEFHYLDCFHSRPTEHAVDLNAVPIPDLNEDLPPVEPLWEEENIRTEPTAEDHYTNASQSIPKDAQENNSAAKSTPIEGNGLASNTAAQSHNGSFPNYVETIRMLEREGHIPRDFGLNFLEWFNFRSTDRERRVVSSYFQVLMDDPQCLGEQLLDAFYDTVLGRPKHS